MDYDNYDDNRTNPNSKYKDIIDVESINDGRGNTGDASGWGSIQYESEDPNDDPNNLDQSYNPFW